MAIIGLLLLAIVVMAFVMRGAPKPDFEKLPAPKSPSSKASTPDPIHPWSSTIKGDIDDFAGPAAPYGPGTEQDPPQS